MLSRHAAAAGNGVRALPRCLRPAPQRQTMCVARSRTPNPPGAMMQPRLSRFLKSLYAHLTRLSWETLALLVAVHFAVSFTGIRQFETGDITEWISFWYFYVTTCATVGYGDLAPKSDEGRALTAIWIMPGGVMLFTSTLAKFIHAIADRWRKRMRGAADYSHLQDHIVILGWQGKRTQRMIQEIQGDVGAVHREIVLCTTKEIENPLPDLVKFVRDKALTEPGLRRRAGIAHAAIVIALGHDDSDTLASALAASADNREGHLVAHFEEESFADLLKAHCPHAEVMVSLSIEMMVRAAQDPGSSRIQQDLLSVKGETQFSLHVPQGVAPVRYGALMALLKNRHQATLLAVARDGAGNGLHVNAPAELPVDPGAVIYYISGRRLRPEEIGWAQCT